MRDAWSPEARQHSIKFHCFSEQRTSVLKTTYLFILFLTPESTENILSSRWESNSRPSEFYPEPKKQLDWKNCFTENLRVYNVSLQGRNVGRVIGQRSRRFGVFTRKIKSHVRNPKILGFLPSTKDLGKNWENYFGSEMSKIKLQKIVGNLLDKFRKWYMNGTEQSSRNL